MKRGTFIFSLLIVCLLVVSGCVPVNLSGFATSTDKSKEDKFKDIIYISEEAKISKEQAEEVLIKYDWDVKISLEYLQKNKPYSDNELKKEDTAVISDIEIKEEEDKDLPGQLVITPGFSPVSDGGDHGDGESAEEDWDNCTDFFYDDCPEECVAICISQTQYTIVPHAILDITGFEAGEFSGKACANVPGSCIYGVLDDEQEGGERLCLDLDGDNYPVIQYLSEQAIEEFGESLEDYLHDDCDHVTDCDDSDYTINPGADEICDEGIDNDCDLLVDEEEEGIFLDCDGHCFTEYDCGDPESGDYTSCLSWIGDGYCDNIDHTWGLNFYCEEWQYDGAICSEGFWDGNYEEGFWCDMLWDVGILGSDCDAHDEQGACGGAEDDLVTDCGDVCFDPNSETIQNWLGDGYCDYGEHVLDFNCEEYDYDDGDCECDEGELDRCLYSDIPFYEILEPGSPDQRLQGCTDDHRCVYAFCNPPGGVFIGSSYVATASSAASGVWYNPADEPEILWGSVGKKEGSVLGENYDQWGDSIIPEYGDFKKEIDALDSISGRVVAIYNLITGMAGTDETPDDEDLDDGPVTDSYDINPKKTGRGCNIYTSSDEDGEGDGSSQSCGYGTYLEQLYDGNCEHYYDCSLWYYDHGDCDGQYYNDENYDSSSVDYSPEINPSNFNDMVDTSLFPEVNSPLEWIFNSFIQITDQISIEGFAMLGEEGIPYYAFDHELLQGEALEFETLFVDSNALSDATIYDGKIFIDYEDLRDELFDNLIHEKHTIRVMSIDSSGVVNLHLRSNLVQTKIAVTEDKYYDLNNDGINDINIQVLNADTLDHNTNLRVSFNYPPISNDFSKLPSQFSEGLDFSKSPDDFLKTLVSFAMILVMLVASFSLMKKAFSLLKSRR